MTIKQALCISVAAISLTLGSLAKAQVPPAPGDGMEISPQPGNLLASQKFDMTIFLPNNFQPVVNSYALLDGRDVSGWFKQCFHLETVSSNGSTSLQCNYQSGAGFGPGPHSLFFDVMLVDGRRVSTTAVYNILSTSKPNTLPYNFLMPSNVPSFGSGVYVTPGGRYNITAAGKITTWAANPMFPFASPKGSISCNASNCLIPGAMTGALVVKIGATGRWIVAGESYSLLADKAGELIFAVNDRDQPDSWPDNIGAFDVTISK